MSEDDWHGTYAGYQRHRREGTEPCTECLRGAAAKQREHRTKPEAAELNRRRMRARGRALTQLAQQHPDEYQRLYVAEMLRTETP